MRDKKESAAKSIFLFLYRGFKSVCVQIVFMITMKLGADEVVGYSFGYFYLYFN